MSLIDMSAVIPALKPDKDDLVTYFPFTEPGKQRVKHGLGLPPEQIWYSLNAIVKAAQKLVADGSIHSGVPLLYVSYPSTDKWSHYHTMIHHPEGPELFIGSCSECKLAGSELTTNCPGVELGTYPIEISKMEYPVGELLRNTPARADFFEGQWYIHKAFFDRFPSRESFSSASTAYFDDTETTGNTALRNIRRADRRAKVARVDFRPKPVPSKTSDLIIPMPE